MVELPLADGNPFTLVEPSGAMNWSGLFDALTVVEEDGSFQSAVAWRQIDALKWKDDDLIVLVSENDLFVSCGPVRSVTPGHEAEISSLYILPGFQQSGPPLPPAVHDRQQSPGQART